MGRARGRRVPARATLVALAGVAVCLTTPSTGASFTAVTESGMQVTAAASFATAVMTTVAGGTGAGTSTTVGVAPRNISVSPAGLVLIPDSENHVVRSYDPSTGALGLVAGVGASGYLASQDGGQATAAMLNTPHAVVADAAGVVYVADTGNNCVRRIDASGVITTYAGQCGTTAAFSGDGGPATSARLNSPRGLDVDAAGVLFVADTFNNRVRRVETDGTISTVAGTGAGPSGTCSDPTWTIDPTTAATAAAIGNANGVAVDGSTVYVTVPHRLLSFPVGGTVTTVRGTACGSQGFNNPRGLDVGSDGAVYVGDTNGQVVRKLAGGTWTTACSGYQAWAAAVAADGTLYVSDSSNEVVRSCSGASSTIVAGVAGHRTATGDGGSATAALVNQTSNAAQLALDGTDLYLADTANNRVRKVAGGVISTIAGTGSAGYTGDGGAATSATYRAPAGLAVSGTTLYVADTGNHRIRKVSGGTSTLVAGNGTGALVDDAAATAGSLRNPNGLAVHGGALYVADTGNNAIRRIVDGGAMTTVAGTGSAGATGDGGPATAATLDGPTALAIAADGTIYVADTGNNVVRVIAPDGTIGTLAGTGTAGFSGDEGPPASAQLSGPAGLALAPDGTLYVADTGNARVRGVRNGKIFTHAGGAVTGFTGSTGTQPAIALSRPRGLAVDTATGALLVVDASNRRVRRLTTS